MIMPTDATPTVEPDLVVPVEDAPPAPLPVDAAGNPAEPWDEEKFLRDQKRQAAEQAWNRMAENDAQARTITDSGAATAVVAGPDGQPAGTAPVVIPEADREAQAAEVQAEADRQRRVAMALISASGLDELSLLNIRIRALRVRFENNKKELAVHKDFRDHPDQYGYVMMDGRTPIVHENEVNACAVLEAQQADIEAELAYYEST